MAKYHPPERYKQVNTCSTCRYFENVANSLILTGQQSNICHRFPPKGYVVAMQMPGGQVGMQLLFRAPETKSEYYCGEWQGIDAQE